jgi:hypothetical protein
MRPIQFVLVGGLLISLGMYWYAFRSGVRNRVLSVLFLLAAMIAVLFPDNTQYLADYLGVGRGADLMIYLFFILGLFFGALFFSKINRIERRQTQIVRALAISAARNAERTMKGP